MSVPTISSTQAKQDLLLVQYPIVFEKVLEEIASGNTLKSALSNDLREFVSGAFLRWINKNPERKQRYLDAKELRTETWAGEIIEISDALDSMEDVNRSKLRIDSRKWLMSADNRKHYGDSTKIDMTATVETKLAPDTLKSEILEMVRQAKQATPLALIPRTNVTDV